MKNAVSDEDKSMSLHSGQTVGDEGRDVIKKTKDRLPEDNRRKIGQQKTPKNRGFLRGADRI